MLMMIWVLTYFPVLSDSIRLVVQETDTAKNKDINVTCESVADRMKDPNAALTRN